MPPAAPQTMGTTTPASLVDAASGRCLASLGVPLRIAILTSGGDASGMNAVVAGACERATALGGELLGVRGGFLGLAERRVEPVSPRDAERHAGESGTWLRTSRWPGLHEAAGRHACADAITALGLQGLVVVGGSGSARGAEVLSTWLPVVLVPATIDADVPGSPSAIGVDSAVAYGVRVVEELRITGRSLPGRAFVVQTLGAPHGHLAAGVASAAGVDEILVPEVPYDLDAVARRLGVRATSGDAVVVMSEAIGDAVDTAAALAERAGVRVHPTILGHAQRAAPPSRLDLAAGRAAGHAAVETLAEPTSALIALDRTGDIGRKPLLA